MECGGKVGRGSGAESDVDRGLWSLLVVSLAVAACGEGSARRQLPGGRAEQSRRGAPHACLGLMQ